MAASSPSRRLRRGAAIGTGGALLALLLASLLAQQPLPDRLRPADDATARTVLLDRSSARLTQGYADGLDPGDWLPLAQVPPLLREAVIEAEDRRYWSHPGFDLRARAGAVLQNLRAGRAVRGASTITEQAVRLLHPRPRSLWSRWIEGFEALRLEARHSKAEILEFYLNRVPYAANRRGVAEAARHHFGRTPDSLSEAEMLALAVLPRAPSRLDPARAPQALDRRVERLAERLVADGRLDAAALARIAAHPARVARELADDAVPATAFVAAVRERLAALGDAKLPARLRTSLDPALQREAQTLLEARTADLARVGVGDGALLVIDLAAGNRVRAWASVRRGLEPGEPGLDTVRVPRQPGSALKPFVYALALERGWRADTLIEDSELAAHVNDGIHPYRNYSRVHYGAVTLREALGNSLNIPAVRALQFVGGEALLGRLRRLGMSGLTAHPDWYGDGLALGNGEVTLEQLVQGYAALARDGRTRPLTVFEEPLEPQPEDAVFSPAAARMIGDILADPAARQLEFGRAGLLRFPASVAVKTGTSTDYRDAWCVAYDRRWVVGAWLGDLGGRAMDGVTGSIGPALLVRSVFSVLAQQGGAAPLRPLPTAEAAPEARAPAGPAIVQTGTMPAQPQLAVPFEGLRVAWDPRVAAELQALAFRLDAVADAVPVRWIVDGERVAETAAGDYRWPLQRGPHSAMAEAADGGWRTPPVHFLVK